MCKFGAKGRMAAKEISTIKHKASSWYKDKRKDGLRTPEESARHHPWQAEGYKSINLSLEKTVPEMPARDGLQRK